MLRRSLFVVAVLSILAATAGAGEIKVHDWPTRYIPQDVCTINVIMDVGYWIHVINQCDNLELQQKDIHTYEGCIDLYIESNFQATLSTKITPTGAIQGWYKSWINPKNISPGLSTVALCARLENANLSSVLGGTEDVHVATITIRVVPQT